VIVRSSLTDSGCQNNNKTKPTNSNAMAMDLLKRDPISHCN